jgi:hypothetical protein
MPTDNRSLLERLRALQGQQQGTPDSTLGLQQSMARMRQRMNPVDNSIPQAPDPSSLPPREGTPEGAPTAASHAAAQAAVDAMNARIKANDDAQKAASAPQDAIEAADVARQNQPQYAEGGEVGYDNHDDDYLKNNGMAHGGMTKFPKLKKKLNK